MARSCLTIILAAGEGKRMASALPKVLHPVAGLPMVCHVLQTARAAGGEKRAVVVGNQAELVAGEITAFDEDASVFEQTERKGTAHAVLAARAAVSEGLDDVIVLYGDVPLIQVETLQSARKALAEGADIVVLGFETADPSGYGRLLMEGDELIAIREDKDASPEEKSVTFCNSGIMAFSASKMLDVLDAIGSDNAQGEYYLPDAVEIGRARGLKAVAISVDEADTLGVNDRIQLAQVEEIWQQRKRHDLLKQGVSMAAPHTVFFHHDTRIARDVILEPNIVFAAGVTVDEGAVIRSFSHLEGARIGRDCAIGPFARLRPGANMEEGSKAGNFVEVKNAQVGKKAKINHLSYIGDADIGPAANIGAGTITCNYNGFTKARTVIGDEAFIGTNTSLVAPVTVGKQANTAAGSVIYSDVPDGDLAIERGKQTNLAGKALDLRERYRREKEAKSSETKK